MRSVLKIGNMRTMEDVSRIRRSISSNQGVIACQINREKQEVEIVYDDFIIKIDNLIESLEDLGYASL